MNIHILEELGFRKVEPIVIVGNNATKSQIIELIKDMGYSIISIDSDGVNAEINGIQTKIRIPNGRDFN